MEENNMELEIDVEEGDTPEDIKKKILEGMRDILKIVNVEESSVLPLIQNLHTTKPLEELSNNFKVLELDDHLLECLKVGDSVSFRGDEEEPVVLCTTNRTYEVREAETSNTVLIAPGLKGREDIIKEGLTEFDVRKVEVTGVYKTYLEARECSPRLGKLLVVLESSSFKGPEYEKTIDKSKLYDWERIQSEIQASDGEIKAALPEYLIAEIDGYYRLIAFEFEARAVPMMLDLIEENSWEIDEIDEEISYESLKDIIPKPVFELLFKKYTGPSEKTKKDGTPLYKYDEAKSSRLLAQILLTACPTNNYDDFMTAWKMGSPESIPPKEEYVHGIALITWNDQKMRKEVVLYPESNLSDNINKRLNELFKMKEKWTVPEITPYISKFATRKQDVNAILTKYARPSTTNGVKYYSSKHGK